MDPHGERGLDRAQTLTLRQLTTQLVPPPPFKETSCQNNNRCCFRKFWNYGIGRFRFSGCPRRSGFFCNLRLGMVFWGCLFLSCHLLIPPGMH